MDELRRSVQNAAIEQKDPLLIYKLESFNLFKAMIDRINEQVITLPVPRGLPTQQPNVQQAQAPRAPQQRLQTSRTKCPNTRELRGSALPHCVHPTGHPCAGRCPRKAPRVGWSRCAHEKKVGRNDPCPCGSGKKYKQCHGKDA
jgi:preprotein translocase subunit SecA